MSEEVLYYDNWRNAQDDAEEQPNTLEIPYLEELTDLVIGDNVKISNRNERFWVKIVAFYEDCIIGRIDNLLITPNLQYNRNDLVVFKRYHIYDYHTIETQEILTNAIADYLVMQSSQR